MKVKAKSLKANNFFVLNNQLLYVVRLAYKQPYEDKIQLVVLVCTYQKRKYSHVFNKQVGPKTLAKASVLGYGDISILTLPKSEIVIKPRYEAVDFILSTCEPYNNLFNKTIELSDWWHYIDNVHHKRLPASVFRTYMNERLNEEEHTIIRTKFKNTLVNGW